MSVNVPKYNVNVPHYDIKPVKVYHLKKSQLAAFFVFCAIVLSMLAEMFAFLSNRASSYVIENISTIMLLTEIATVLLIAVFILSILIKGKASLIILDMARYAAVVLLCFSVYYLLTDRATLMGYVWFSDLASGSADAVKALNYSVVSAALYVVAIIMLAVSCGWDLVPANKARRSREDLIAEIEALQKELAAYTDEPSGKKSKAKKASNNPAQIRYNAYGGPTDEFINRLTVSEQIEFCQLFIEKINGSIKDVPDYVVGGDNKEFFAAIIRRLGRVRRMLSDGLLEKIQCEYNATR